MDDILLPFVTSYPLHNDWADIRRHVAQPLRFPFNYMRKDVRMIFPGLQYFSS